MTIFLHEGSSRDDHILLNGCRDWAIVPGGTIQGFNSDLPIRVLAGDSSFGYKHIFKHQGRKQWMEGLAGSIEDFIYMKLGQSGDIFETEGRESIPRIKIAMRTGESSLLIFDVRGLSSNDPYLSFVTAYFFNRSIGEYKLGRYLWKFRADFEALG